MMGTSCNRGGSGRGSRTIEAMLPRDHLLRRVDRLLDMGELRAALAWRYSARGRPAVDPELLIRMALLGRITPSGRSAGCEQLRYSLAYRCFCRLAADAAVPHIPPSARTGTGDFATLTCSGFLFENTVRRCIAEGVVPGKDAGIDASFMAADASWQRKVLPANRPGAGRASRSVREWFADRTQVSEPLTGTGKGFPGVSRTGPAAA